jgi:CHASE2 domain-containing sensor protein
MTPSDEYLHDMRERQRRMNLNGWMDWAAFAVIFCVAVYGVAQGVQ